MNDTRVGFTVVKESASKTAGSQSGDMGDASDTGAVSAARLGVASFRGQSVQTPCVLVHTGKGCSPNVTWDGLQRIGELSRALDPASVPSSAALVCQLDVLQLVHQAANIKAFPSSAPSSDPLSAKAFLGFPHNAVVVATPRNPISYEHVGMTRHSTDARASFMTVQGAAWTTPEEYMDLACRVGADIVVALGDEVVSDARVNRVVESSKRTIRWMARTLDWLGVQTGRSPFLVCPIVGGKSLEKRRDAITYMPYIEDPRVHGVYVSGLGTGDSAAERQAILRHVVARVPRDKLRMVSGVSNPMEVLEAVRCGVDMFDTCFVESVTRAGLALCFPTDDIGSFENDAAINLESVASADTGYDGMKINLWSVAYKLDRAPMVQDCPCASCREHTRAYVHHLLVTHEMTAHVLLEQHNVYHMLRFFAGIRKAIRDGVFEGYYDAFAAYTMRWMMQGFT